MQLDRPLAVATPTLDGDVLAALVYRRMVGSTPGQIQYLLGRHTTQGIRLCLRRLTEQGVVQRRRAGNAFEYRLHPDHLATPAIVALATARRRLVVRTAAVLKRWPVPPVYAAFFGPSVAPDMGTHDWIDLFIAYADTDGHVVAEHAEELAARLRTWTGNLANIVTMAEDDVPSHMQDDVLLDVDRTGLRIIGWPSWLARQHARRRELVRAGEATRSDPGT